MAWGSVLRGTALIARFQPSHQIAFTPTNGANTDLNGRWKGTGGYAFVDGTSAQAAKLSNGRQALDAVIHIPNPFWHLPTKNQSFRTNPSGFGILWLGASNPSGSISATIWECSPKSISTFEKIYITSYVTRFLVYQGLLVNVRKMAL